MTLARAANVPVMTPGRTPAELNSSPPLSPDMRTSLGLALLLFQVVMIINARFVPSRYFCWAPMDSQNLFEVDVIIDGRALTEEEILGRYRQPKKGGNWQAIQHVKDKIQQYEQTYGRDDHAEITLRYTVNGGREQIWRWPPE